MNDSLYYLLLVLREALFTRFCLARLEVRKWNSDFTFDLFEYPFLYEILIQA
jgi:hypothetical protein